MLQVHVTNVLAIAIVFFRILAVATPEAIAEAAIRTKWPHKIHSVPTLDQGNHEKPKPKNKPLWTHKDHLEWPKKFPTCGGRRQSPIDIHPKSTELEAFPSIKFHNYGLIDNLEFVNNGHSAAANLPKDFPKDKTPGISGGGLNDTYAFVQIHMHWGSDASKGSEHVIKSQSYPIELHFVHYNTKYGSFAEASRNAQDGLAVLAVLATVSPSDSKAFQPMVDQLGEIVHNGDETILRSPLSLNRLLPRRTSSFYRYFGSLTTPDCQEIVTWTIFDNTIEISERQLNAFRMIKDEVGEPMVNNFRTPQPLNERTVFYRSFTGCEISRSLTDNESPESEALKWSKCLMSYAFNSILPSS
ncbi:Carbonic anhydrase-related protein 10 [Daphnia magna]|uniref:Carbonic anhydrase n=1 Tax=Daphnia magna TaxID=35525 RepID=A0A0P5VK37_9CRUS|nr:Carbonic anhydrase-related protein 10 [Daphnia magna]